MKLKNFGRIPWHLKHDATDGTTSLMKVHLY